MSQSRQLAAIMFTDIVGYTALMEEDEQQAFELLKKNRSIQRPIIEKYHGKWLKEIGDGVLASFSTVTDAVYCAIEIQHTCQQQADLKLRIGIHQGEVVFEGEDVFGSGVNIASRLEPLAPVGGILVSGAVYKNILNKKGIQATFIEERELRGVREPVKIYQVQVGDSDQELISLSKPGTTSEQKLKNPGRPIIAVTVILLLLAAITLWYVNSGKVEAKQPVEIPDKSIAIIPFKDLSPLGDQQWFSDGIMDAVLSNLSKISDLRVISRTSMEQYRDTTLSVSQIADLVNVAYILEGSAQRIEDKVRVIVQLIEAGANEKHIWSETYFRDTVEVFQVQSELARHIAEELQAELSPQVETMLDQVPTENLEAYNQYLKGLQYYNSFLSGKDEQDLRLSIHFFEVALKLDPEFFQARVNLAWTYVQRSDLGEGRHLYDSALHVVRDLLKSYSDQSELVSLLANIHLRKGSNKVEAKQMLMRALALNPNDPNIIKSMSDYCALEESRYDLALVLDERRAGIQPDDPEPYYLQGASWLDFFDPDRAEGLYLKALEIQPNYARVYVGLNNIYCYWRGDCQKGLAILKQGLSYTQDPRLVNQLALCYSWNEDFEESEKLFLIIKNQVEQEDYVIVRRTPWFPHRYAYTLWNLGKKEQAQKYFEQQIERDLNFLEENVRFAGYSAHYDLASVYAFLGEKERAYYWLNELLANKSWGPEFYMLRDPLFDPIKGEPRFQQFIEAYNDRMERQRKHYEEIKDLPFAEFIKKLDQPLPSDIDILD